MFQMKVVEKIKTLILYTITFSQKSYRLRDNVEKYYRAGQVTDDMSTACCIPQATQTHTHTHSEYVTLIVFPPQQWLHERPSVLRYTYTACLVRMAEGQITITSPCNFNPLKTRHRLLYLKTQFVPRSKHFSSRL